MSDISNMLITVAGEDDALGLREWLSSEDAFRGRVRMHDGPVREGTMSGGVLDTVSLMITGGGLTAATTAIVTYLRTRGMKVRVTAKVGEQSVSIDSERVRRVALPELEAIAARLARELRGDPSDEV